jgi:sugar phosphate isomerase/epimerase
MAWSFQLYSARDFQPWADVLKTLGELGYKQVEGFGGVYTDPPAFRAELEKNGLSMTSGHFALDLLENDFAKAESIASTFGIKLIACPYIQPDDRPTDAEGWKDLGKRLGAIGKCAKDAGYDFGWHNHDFEFVTLPDGSTPQARIFEGAPDLGWEMDVAWVIRGGADPLQWINDYGRQIVAAHVKDIAPAGENADEDGWADVGYGTVDWKSLIDTLEAKTAVRYLVMEHDKPSDFKRFAKRSIETVKGY